VTFRHILCVVAMVILLPSACGGTSNTAPVNTIPSSTLSATTAPASVVAGLVPFDGFDVAVVSVGDTHHPVLLAATQPLRSQGLMFVEDLEGWTGMWFQFEEPRAGGFWMKNTLIPLSIAWIDESGTVVAVANMVPCEVDSCPVYIPGLEYISALEVALGGLAGLGISLGSTVQMEPIAVR
jgi:uncharacterized membrane protein (UPF0127 family)